MQKWNKRKSEDQSKNLRWEKQPPWLGQFPQGRLGARDKCIKRRNQDGSRPRLWDQPALTPRGCTFLGLLNKTLSCKQAVTLIRCVSNLCCGKTEPRKLHTPPTYLHIIFIVTRKHFLEFTNKIVLPVAWYNCK